MEKGSNDMVEVKEGVSSENNTKTEEPADTVYLLHLVKQQYRIWSAAYSIGKLSPLVISFEKLKEEERRNT